ncbi:MAG: leucyl aminopeptidase family protein [Myxococcales bacterium]|nr:leucyl aminopeptidase family protein [Myxococcales bacterium]MCB9543999.1 leucyl aminopeptidase family protein [Myxococcales bacterium]
MQTELHFCDPASALDGARTCLFVGRRDRLLGDDVAALLPEGASKRWEAMIDAAPPGDGGATASTFIGDGGERLVAAVLPDACSRHNTPTRAHAITKLVSDAAPAAGEVAVVVALEEAAHAVAAGAAVARALPLFSRKTGEQKARRVRVALLAGDEGKIDLERVEVIADAVRTAARLVDTPPNELHTDAFVDFARSTAARLDVDITVLQGAAVANAGLGGLWAVGKAAARPPALVVLQYTPPEVKPDAKTIAWVGKGIVYDTGGLSLKPKDGMAGMKGDMGGAAAVIGAFTAAVRLGTPHRIVALLCLAENAIGPRAFRNDDIITLYSGKAIEVNNTDAEGRLVLSDGVAYAVRHHGPDVVIDVATLTGAQLIATGKRHAASVCNDDALEAAAVAAGRITGDLVHPLPYVPEFFRSEFKSPVADLKNSVKDRMNAQSSCAGQFIAENLGDYSGPWLHLDIAGPSGLGERGSGFGVALLVDLLGRI